MSGINYSEKIPNNVDIATDRTLQRALEHWQPKFLDWWRGMGPTDFQGADVYLRTATSVDADGWATYGTVKMPDYRWGIFLADRQPDRAIGFGDAMGEPSGQTSARWRVLAAIDEEPLSVAQIARAWWLTRQSVQRVADVLVEDGLATYEDNPHHRRAKLVRQMMGA